MASEIPGYDYGSTAAASSPLSLAELRQLEQAVGWTDEDAHWLQRAAQTLVPQAEAMVTRWREEIGRQPHLMAAFSGPDGTPDDHYRSVVKQRFVKWVSDLCLRPHDQDWLDYQEEIGLRHTPAKKNETDDGHTPSVVPLRYTLGFAGVVITSLRDFLASSDWNEEERQRIQDAWTRGVLLSLTLWSRPYTEPGLW